RLSLQIALGARAIVTVSEFSRSEILALTSARASQVHAVLPGVAPWPAGLVPRRPAALAEDRFALLVGDNRPRKNIDVAIRAWAALGAEPPLALVGAGPVASHFPAQPDLARAA